jgi:hypothetical protein
MFLIMQSVKSKLTRIILLVLMPTMIASCWHKDIHDIKSPKERVPDRVRTYFYSLKNGSIRFVHTGRQDTLQLICTESLDTVVWNDITDLNYDPDYNSSSGEFLDNLTQGGGSIREREYMKVRMTSDAHSKFPVSFLFASLGDPGYKYSENQVKDSYYISGYSSWGSNLLTKKSGVMDSLQSTIPFSVPYKDQNWMEAFPVSIKGKVPSGEIVPDSFHRIYYVDEMRLVAFTVQNDSGLYVLVE